MESLILIGRRGGFLSGIVGWFIRIVIYEICIGTIASVLGVSRWVALFIFLGILMVISLVGYILRQRMASRFDDL